MAETITVDDADPRIQYTDGWITSGQAIEYDGTTHGTGKDGVTATFTFSGFLISVYGTVGSPTNMSAPYPTSMYSIDGSAPVVFNAGTPSSTPLFHHRFYQSPVLKDGQHTLVITCNAANTSSFFWLDYIQFNLVASTSPSVVPSTITVISINQTIASTVPTSSSTSPIITSSKTTKTGSSRTPTGAIIGAVIGGTIFLAIAFFLIWCCRRRAHGQIKGIPAISDVNYWNGPQRTTDITPFNIPEASNSRRHVQDGYSINRGLLVGPGFGYTTRGTTPLEKRYLSSVQPSHFQSQATSSSSTGLICARQDPGGQSPPHKEINNSSSSYIHGNPLGAGNLAEETPPAYQALIHG